MTGRRMSRVEAASIVLSPRKMMWRRLTEELFEVAVALAWLLVGATFLPAPTQTAERSPVGRDLGVFATGWSILFIVGGVLTIWGVVRGELGVRVAGLVLLTTGLLMEGIAAATFSFTPRVAVYFVYAAACGARALMLTLEHRRRV